MAEANADEWELSKENVQPLKQGRSFAQLSAALKPNATAIRQQQECFETEIRTYNGEDPLGIWVKYISWTEQTFPKGGKDGDVQTLLKNCVIHFKDDMRYHNDPRYIKIWIKFADYTTNPGQLYEFLFNQKIGCQIADFYEAWAVWFERCGNRKMADAVYIKGIEQNAQPIDRLQKRHSEFQARVARAVIDSIRTSGEAMDEEPVETGAQRSKLGNLKPLGRTGQAPVVRIPSDRPERLPRTSARPQTTGSSSVQIYNDENAVSCRLPPQNQEFSQVPLPEVTSRENQPKPSKWTDARVKQKGAIGGSSRQASHVPFVLHEDANIQQPFITPHKIADGTGILSVRQEPASSNAFDGVISNSEACDQKVMYCKEKLFVGVKEFSFEELRAAAWFQKKRQEREFEDRLQKEVQRQLQIALQSMNFNQLSSQSGSQTTSSNISDQLQSRLAPNSSTSSNGVFSQSEEAPMEEFLPLQSLFPVQNESTSVLENFSVNPLPKCSRTELAGGHVGTPMSAFAPPTDPWKSVQHPAAEAHSIMMGPGFWPSNAVQDLASGTADVNDVYMATPDSKAVPGTKTVFEPKDASYLTRPSPTVNTKHALEVVRNMFRFDNSIKQERVDAEFENQFLLDSDENICTNSGQFGKDMQSSRPQTIAIYTDPSPAKLIQPFAKQPSGGINIFIDPSPKPLTVFEDPSPPKGTDTKKDLGGIFVYEDPAPAKWSGGCMAVNGQSAGDQLGKWPVPDKENIVGRRALRPLADRDVVPPPQPAAGKDEGAFVPAPQGQLCAEKGVVSESDGQRFSVTSAQRVPGVDSAASICVRLSDDIMSDEPEDVHMADAADWCFDAFDPAAELTFDPKMSSTTNLTQIVRLAGGASDGCAVQPLSGLRNAVADDDHFNPQLQTAQGKTFKSVEPPQRHAKKASFCFDLDTIQEGSEESKSRGSSVDSRNSSGRPLGTGSSSGSSGSRSSLHHHLSQSTIGSAFKPSSTGCHDSMQVASGSAVSHGHSFGMRTASGDRILGKVAEVRSFIGEDVQKNNVVDEHEVSFLPEQSVMEEPGKGLADASVFIDQKNPYSTTEIQTFLQNLSTPLNKYRNYHQIEGSLPKFAVRSKVRIGDKIYTVKARLGEGGYAKVYRVVDTAGKDNDGNAVVAKVQSPACPWEFYITTELHRRLSLLKDDVDISPSIMFIDKAFFYDDGNCFFNQHHAHGTLLDFVNSYKLNKQSIPEWLVLYIGIELFHIIEQLHKCQVVHGDFKPDNILILQPRRLSVDETGLDLIRGQTSFLKLIDFGQSIDMTMFPPGTTFMTSTSAFGFQCPEVLSKRPWTFQPDLFGLVATMYVVLFGNYMKLFCSHNEWTASMTFSRSLKSRNIWKQMFHTFFNIPDCDSLPDLPLFRSQLEDIFLKEFSVEAYNNLVDELEALRRGN